MRIPCPTAVSARAPRGLHRRGALPDHRGISSREHPAICPDGSGIGDARKDEGGRTDRGRGRALDGRVVADRGGVRRGGNRADAACRVRGFGVGIALRRLRDRVGREERAAGCALCQSCARREGDAESECACSTEKSYRFGRMKSSHRSAPIPIQKPVEAMLPGARRRNED